MTKAEAQIKQLEKATARLAEVLDMEKNTINRDASIQRFEFTFDLAWKTLKEYLMDYLKIRCASPKKCFREAYRQSVIEYEQDWNNMADDRNATAHMYKEELADAVYVKLPGYLELIQALLKKLQSETKRE